MCQLNLYITEATDEAAIKKALGKYADKADITVNGIPGTSYCIGWCNCDSLPSKATQCFAENMNEKKYDTLAEYYEAGRKFLVEKGKRIAKARKEPDFKEKLKAYREEYQNRVTRLTDMTSSVAEYESQQTSKLYNMDISDEERSVRLHKLYDEIAERLKEIENTDEYLAQQEKFRQYVSENELYEEAKYFTAKSNNEILASLPDRLASDISEYRSIRRKIGALLKLSDKVTLYLFWQDGSTVLTPIETREICLQELNVDVIATLPYDVALIIRRK